MSSKEKKKEDSRPVYVAPQVIRLNDISSGIGASCAAGGSPQSGSCVPVGNGATLVTCTQGNGAKGACFPNGNGVK